MRKWGTFGKGLPSSYYIFGNGRKFSSDLHRQLKKETRKSQSPNRNAAGDLQIADFDHSSTHRPGSELPGSDPGFGQFVDCLFLKLLGE
jgi:hypothetical protein